MVMLAASLLQRLGSASKVPTDTGDACCWPVTRLEYASKLPADTDDACRWPVQRLSLSSEVPADAGGRVFRANAKHACWWPLPRLDSVVKMLANDGDACRQPCAAAKFC